MSDFIKESLCTVVLGMAGVEIILFLGAAAVLCFGFRMRVMLNCTNSVQAQCSSTTRGSIFSSFLPCFCSHSCSSSAELWPCQLWSAPQLLPLNTSASGNFYFLLIAGLILTLITLWLTINVNQFEIYWSCLTNCFVRQVDRLLCQELEMSGNEQRRRGDFSPSCCGAVWMEREQWDVSCVPGVPFCPCCWASLHGTPLSNADLPQIPLRKMIQDIPHSCTCSYHHLL